MDEVVSKLEDLEIVKLYGGRNKHSYWFSDALENAYTAVVYEGGSITARLIMSRLAPLQLKAVSIPRLELLGLRLTRQVCSGLKIPIHEVCCWVDSMNIGHWIENKSIKRKQFIAHRVGGWVFCSLTVALRYYKCKPQETWQWNSSHAPNYLRISLYFCRSQNKTAQSGSMTSQHQQRTLDWKEQKKYQ